MKQSLSINNKQMEIFQKGNTGVPLLILTGMGCSFEEWHAVTEILSKTNRVIMFHRPGLGESEAGNSERTTLSVVNEITSLLSVMKITEPIVLVGHSYGGLCAQHFTKIHKNKVQAVVLVDSTSEDLKKLDDLDLPVLNEDGSDEEWMEMCKSYALKSEAELRNLITPLLTEQQKKLPVSIQENLIHFQHNPNLYQTMVSEVESWKADARAIKELGDFGNLPLIIIGRDKKHMIKLGELEGLPVNEVKLLEETWEQLIRDQSKLSSDSRLVFAQQAGHSVYLDRPDLLVELITKLMKGSRYSKKKF